MTRSQNGLLTIKKIDNPALTHKLNVAFYVERERDFFFFYIIKKHGQKDGQTNRRIDGQFDKRIDIQKERLTDELIDRRKG